MKRKKYLHTKFLNFLIESEKQSQKENELMICSGFKARASHIAAHTNSTVRAVFL